MTIQLTDKQKAITTNPLYWEQFQKWWVEDFSWEGLKNKKDHEGTFLRSVYAIDTQSLLTAFGKKWHPLHLPLHDPDGNSNGYTRRQIGTFTELIQSTSQFSTVILIGIFGSDRNEFLKFKNKTIFIQNCFFPHNITFNCERDELFQLHSSYFATSVTIISNQIEVVDILTPVINISPSIISNINITNSKINLRIPFDQNCSIYFKNTSEHRVLLKSLDAVLQLSEKHRLTIRNYTFNHLELNSTGLKYLEIYNSNINEGTFSLEHFTIDNMQFSHSKFNGGIRAVNAEFLETIQIYGCKFYNETSFENSTFYKGIEIGSKTNEDGTKTRSMLENVDFTKSKIYRGTDNNNVCLNFNGADFIGSAFFDQSLFDGIPKFHGSTLPQETSFHDLKPIPDIEKNDILDPNLCADYQAAFRTLRQHMENNNSYADAFDFGRMEMIAKQRRIGSNDVPKWERWFTRQYGKIADYGQDALQPLRYLLIVWIGSVTWQWLIQYLSSDCHLNPPYCLVDWDKTVAGVERSLLFSFPPFSLFTSKAISMDQITQTISDEAPTQMNIWFQFFSGLGLVVHGILSTLLIFLFLLAMKRRLQIR